MKECFISKVFNLEHRALVDQMVEICEIYRGQGYDLSLRQLYYQLVARNIIPNTEQSYKRIGGILSDARLAGLVDWEMIVDRGRETSQNVHWDSPAEMVRYRARSFQIDKWEGQPYHVEVMVEKQALEGVLQPVCSRLDIPFTANKGYSSSSALYEAGQRLRERLFDPDRTKKIRIIYLGDHDPSGIDMTRDVDDRLAMFAGYKVWDDDENKPVIDGDRFYGEDPDDDPSFAVVRVALNRDQIDRYSPPPNPAKLTDSRATAYIRDHGRSSWELDALEPSVLANLVTEQVEEFRDADLWDASVRRERNMRSILSDLADRAEAEEAEREGRS